MIVERRHKKATNPVGGTWIWRWGSRKMDHWINTPLLPASPLMGRIIEARERWINVKFAIFIVNSWVKYNAMKRLKWIWLIFLGSFLFFSACNQKKNEDLREEDRSFDTEWYIRLGVPDYKTEWSINDYAYALQVLSGIQLKYPHALPVLNSRKSGALFEKLVSDENFSFLNGPSGLIKKARTLLHFSRLYDELAELYYNPEGQKQYYWRELIEIYIFGLKLSQHMLDVGREIELAPDPSLDEFKAGLFEVRDSYIAMAHKIIRTTGQTDFYAEKDLIRLADLISQSLHKNEFWMNPSQKKIIVEALDEVIDETPAPQIKEEYEDIRHQLKT